MTYHLVSKHEHGLERELALAVVEQVLEGGTEQVDYHYVVIAFDPKPVHIWNSD